MCGAPETGYTNDEQPAMKGRLEKD